MKKIITVLFSIFFVSNSAMAKNPWIVSVTALPSCNKIVEYNIVLKAIYSEFSNDGHFIKIGGSYYQIKRVGESVYFDYSAQEGSVEEFWYGVAFGTSATSSVYFALEDGTVKAGLVEEIPPMQINFPKAEKQSDCDSAKGINPGVSFLLLE